eukprot:11948966-Alexandrium_andersonii.AAC.1
MRLLARSPTVAPVLLAPLVAVAVSASAASLTCQLTPSVTFVESMRWRCGRCRDGIAASSASSAI